MGWKCAFDRWIICHFSWEHLIVKVKEIIKSLSARWGEIVVARGDADVSISIAILKLFDRSSWLIWYLKGDLSI